MSVLFADLVIADSSKTVDVLHAPVPLELLSFGLAATMRRIGSVKLRDVPDGGVKPITRVLLTTQVPWPNKLASTPGVVEHGMFPPEMVAIVLVARGESVERTDFE